MEWFLWELQRDGRNNLAGMPMPSCKEMRASNYENIVEVFEREFCGPNGVCELINKPGDAFDDDSDKDLED